MRVVGREAERDAIGAVIEGARQGRSSVLAVTGEAGIGKSALLELGVEMATGMRVLDARGVQSEARIPFAGLSELLRPALAHLDRIPPHHAAALEGALALVPARSADRFVLGAATLSLLSSYADDVPVLVVVDDAHWLDGSSADALSFAFRRLLADPVAVLIAAREGEPSFLDGSDLPVVHLHGLDADSTAVLLADRVAIGTGVGGGDGSSVGALSVEAVDRLHRHTGGNPLALLEAAREADRLSLDAPLDVPLPVLTSVTDAYLARARAFGEATRAVLLLAAAADVGDVSTLSRAAARLGRSLDELAPAEEGGFVELRDAQVRFCHPLARSAVYADAAPHERRAAHTALAAALPDADSDRRAWHLALGAAGTDETACFALEQSAIRSRDRNAYDAASRTFERAALLAADDDRQRRLRLAAAESAWSAGDGIRAGALLDQVGLWTAGARVGESGAAGESAGTSESGAAGGAAMLTIAASHLRGRIAARLGPVADGIAILLATADRAEETDPDGAAIMLAEAVNVAFYAADGAMMRRAAERLAGVAERVGSDRARFFAVMARGMAHTFAGDADEGADLMRQGAALAELAGTDDPTWMTWAAMGPLYLRERGTGREIVARATEVARSRAAIDVLPFLLSHVAIDHMATDRWDEAEATFHEVLGLAGETQQLTDRVAALSRLAWLEARQGREELCKEHAGEALRLADELGLRLCTIWALAAEGDLHLGAGRAAEAIEVLTALQDLLIAHHIEDVDLSPAPELVELFLRQGSTGPAAELAAEYEERAARKGQPWAIARAARCRGLLCSDEEVDAEFAAAFEAHARTPDAFETARTELAYGARLRRSRHRVRARAPLREAIATFDRLGAQPWSAAARAELAATGETARERVDSTRRQLTPQELQIALLLTTGNRTTREAAATLFLSPKTVEYHLRNVYRKLGCNTREDLARVLEADGA